MPNVIRLRRTTDPPEPNRNSEAIYADADGTLKQVAPDGSETDLGGGGGASFTPTDLNGQVGLDWAAVTVLGWWDASDAATIHEADASGFVSQWDDKSGEDNHATQATGANQPTTGAATIGGLNALGFDGAATFLETPLNAGIGLDGFVACVFKAGAVDLDSFNYALLAFSTRLQLDNSASDPELQGPNVSLSLSGVDLAAAHVAAWGGTSALSSGGEVVRLDALALSAAGSSGAFSGLLGIGADAGADAFFLGGIGEMVFAAGTLSPEQQQNVIDYLADHWGITL